MPDASNADPNNPEQNLPVENPADPELLSDDDAIDMSLPFVRNGKPTPMTKQTSRFHSRHSDARIA